MIIQKANKLTVLIFSKMFLKHSKDILAFGGRKNRNAPLPKNPLDEKRN